MKASVFSGLAFAGLASAAPVAEPFFGSISNSLQCLLLQTVSNALDSCPIDGNYQGKQLFCQAYLGLDCPQVTAVITQYATVTATSTIGATSTAPTTTTTVIVTASPSCGAGIKKRTFLPVPALPNYLAWCGSSQVSQACSCLNLVPQTVTTSSTTTATSTTTVLTTQVKATVTPTVTVTSTTTIGSCPVSTTAASTPPASVSLGCYTDSNSNRALPDFPMIDTWGMTVDKCKSYCGTFGALYYGVEFGTQCFCANSIQGGNVPAPSSDCNSGCTGNFGQICGGANRINIYGPKPFAGPYVTITSGVATTPITQAPTGTATVGTVIIGSKAPFTGPYVTITSGTATVPVTQTPSGTATVGTVIIGSKAPFTGPYVTVTSGTATVPVTQTPSGTATVGTVVIGSAPASASIVSLGCYTDSNSNRALPDFPMIDTWGMTVDKCKSYCGTFGALYYGVEFGTQCFCANSIQGGSIPAPSSDCNSVCTGNSGQICGGGNRINIYGPKPFTGPYVTITSGTATGPITQAPTGTATVGTVVVGSKAPFTGPYVTVTSGTATIPVTQTPSGTATIGTVIVGSAPASASSIPLGCYTDSNNNRALPDFPMIDTWGMTIDKCKSYCGTFGALYYGVEFGTQCFCANSIQGGNVPAPSSDCNIGCTGNSGQICGGTNRINIYGPKPFTGPYVTITSGTATGPITQAPTGTATVGTVVIGSTAPFTGPYVTITSGTATGPITQAPTGTATVGTVIVGSKAPFTGPYVTITSGTATGPITQAPTGTATVGTVIVGSKAPFTGPYVTITSGTATGPITQAPTGTATVGTVVIGSTAPFAGPYTTITSGTATGPITRAPTGTATVGTVIVPSTATAAPTSCGNAGVQWAAYKNQAGDNPPDSTYPSFNPAVYKTAPKLTGGQTTSVGGFSGDGSNSVGTFYGQSIPNLFLVLNHRGYIYAAQAGTYTFKIDTADDIGELWLGSNAYSGWTRANANQENFFSNTQSTVTWSTTLTKGTYTPFRIIWANAQMGYNFNFQMIAPDGTVILGSGTSANQYIVSFSCDGTSAPAFPAFSSET